MKTLTCLVVTVLGCLAICQAQEDGKPKRTPHAKTVVSTAPVTQAEAEATFVRIRGLFKTVLHVSVSSGGISKSSGSSVTKAQVVAELSRLYRAAEPSFTMTPRKASVDTARVVAENPQTKSSLITLIEVGFVGNFGPLATMPKATLSVSEFGDSLGFFLSRISDCTHVPSTKWTPYLHN